MFGVGISELLVILLVCLLLFGANRLPEIGKSLGEGIREFKKSMKDAQDK
jgi:sec-independent protein translocase protein TatA